MYVSVYWLSWIERFSISLSCSLTNVETSDKSKIDSFRSFCIWPIIVSALSKSVLRDSIWLNESWNRFHVSQAKYQIPQRISKNKTRNTNVNNQFFITINNINNTTD